MTTIMGIKVYDPVRERESVLFASDSKVHYRGERDKGIERKSTKKIWTNTSESMMFAYAGMIFFPPEGLEDKRIGKKARIFLDSPHDSLEETKRIMDSMEEFNHNGYIFANKRDMALKVYNLGDIPDKEYAVQITGSGPKMMKERGIPFPDFDVFGEVDKKGIHSNLEPLLRKSLDTVSRAKGVDEHTGEYFIFGLLTRTDCLICNGFAYLEDKLTTDERMNAGIQEVLKDERLIERGVRSIDDLVLI